MNKTIKKLLTAVCATMLCIGMTACAPISVECVPFNMDMAEQRMEKAGYELKIFNSLEEVYAYVGTEAVFGAMEGFEKALFAMGDDIYPEFIAIYFESEDAAKNFIETAGVGDEVKQAGRWVYSGEYKAIESFEELFKIF